MKMTRRAFVATIGAGACGVLVPREGALLPPPHKAHADSIHGMFTMGAYGDALGAWNESSGALSGKCFDPGACRMLGTADRELHPWGYWALDPNGVMVTDDTAFRTMILQPYLLACARGGATSDEPGLLSFMKEMATRDEEDFDSLRAAQIKDWFRMYRAAERGESFLFYTPGEPVVFGPYMWMEAAPLEDGDTPGELFSKFRKRCTLDQGAGQSFTGLLAAATAMAARVGEPPVGTFHKWFDDFTDKLVAQLLDEHRDLSVELVLLADAKTEASELARGWSRSDARAFVAHLERWLYRQRRFTTMKQHNYASVLFWMQMCAAVAFAAEDDALILRVLASAAGDSDTMASMMGTVIGAFYGRAVSGRIRGLDEALEPELTRVEALLKSRFQVDLAARAKALTFSKPA